MAEPKGYELIQLKLKKTAAAVRMSGGQLKEQSDEIRDLINTCEDFLSDETLSPMEALKKSLIANLIKLLAPTVGISTESMPSTSNNSVKGQNLQRFCPFLREFCAILPIDKSAAIWYNIAALAPASAEFPNLDSIWLFFLVV